MTLSELRQLVVDAVGRTDKTSVINNGLNLGLKELGKLHDFRAMREESDHSLVDTDESVAVPTGMFHLLEARLIDGTMSFPSVLRSKKWITERWPNISALSSNKPNLGYEEGGLIYLYPVCNGSYTLRVTVSSLPANFASDSTENPLVGTDYTLAAWATAYVYETVEQFEQGAFWRSRFSTSALADIRADKRVATLYQASETSPNSDDFRSPEPWLDPFARRSR